MDHIVLLLQDPHCFCTDHSGGSMISQVGVRGAPEFREEPITKN